VVKKLSHGRVGGTRRADGARWRHGIGRLGTGGERSEPMLTSGKISYEIGGNV